METNNMFVSEVYVILANDNKLSPRIREGDILYCEAGLPLKNGDLVHFKFKNLSGIRIFLDYGNMEICLNTTYNKESIIISKKDKSFYLAKIIGKIDTRF